MFKEEKTTVKAFVKKNWIYFGGALAVLIVVMMIVGS